MTRLIYNCESIAGSFLNFQQNDRSFESSGPRRRKRGIHIRMVNGIELRPKNIALGPESVDHLFLLLASLRVFRDKCQSKARILRGLRQSPGEIIQPAREPGIMLFKNTDPERDERRREKLRQR